MCNFSGMRFFEARTLAGYRAHILCRRAAVDFSKRLNLSRGLRCRNILRETFDLKLAGFIQPQFVQVSHDRQV